MSMKKICIVGLGAIGGWLAARLAGQPGVELSALARGATLAAVRAEGLRFENSAGEATRVALHASDDAAALGAQDLVVVALKGPALGAASAQIARLIGPHTRVLVAMNGVPWWFLDGLRGDAQDLRLASVDPGGRIRAAIPTAQVIGCVVHAACTAPAPGVVRHVQGRGLIVGVPAGGRPPELERVAALLGAAGFELTVSERIQQDIWYKLWGNMTMNPVSALTRATCDRILDDELVRGFVSQVMREAAALGARIGCPVEQEPEARHAVTRKLGAFKTSMLQDLEAGRPLELAALLGAPYEIARHLGMATPALGALLGLTRLMDARRGAQ